MRLSSGSRAYNAESQMTSTAGVTYTSDGDGRRVKKSNGTLYWYGTGTDALDETDLSGNLANEYVFFGGKRIARRDASSNIFYYAEDHLGTSRAIVQAGQTSPCYDADFYPFGGERTITNTCPQNYKFTGKERDSESGLDEFDARYYSSAIGRFTIPDWAANATAVPYADFGDPQSLNLYGYVRNNPLSRTDPDGHECFADGSCNALRNPLSADHWIVNGLSNTLSDLLSLDTVAHGAAAAGNPDLSTKDRVIGGAKVVGVGVVDTVGGELLGKGISKVIGAVGSKLAPETAEAITKLLTPKEANIAKAESIVGEYTDSALSRSARKAEQSIARHEDLLKKGVDPREQRGIANDIRKAEERLEAIRRERARRALKTQ